MFVHEYGGRSAAAWRTGTGADPSASADGFRTEFAQLQREIATTIALGFGAGGADDGDFAMRDGAPLPNAAAMARLLGGRAGQATPDKQAFLDNVLPYAREAGATLGVSADLIAAHAALESGWGRRPLVTGGGVDSYNLFGVKAGAGWAGGVADVLTTEYVGGDALKSIERFRAYPDQRTAFSDYVDLLRGNPRYRGVIGAGGDAEAFAAALVKGGYATDPAYAAKLRQVAADVAATRSAAADLVSVPRQALAERSARPSPAR